MNIDELDRAVIPFVSKKLNKQLTPEEVGYVKRRIRGNNFEKTGVKDLVRSIMSEVVYMQIETTGTQDIHEYNKSQIGERTEDNNTTHRFGTNLAGNDEFNKQLVIDVTKFMQFNKDSLFALSRAMNPASKEYYSYIMFDSDNRNTSLSTDGVLAWQLNDGPPSYTQGTINLYNKLNKIIKMRLGRITYGNLHIDEYLKLVNSTSKRFTVTIPDYNAQALVHQNGNKFHFIQQLLTPYYGSDPTTSSFFENRGWFRFHEPHRNTSKISLRISDAFTPESPIIIHETEASFEAGQLFGVVIANPAFGVIYDPLLIPNNVIPALSLHYGNISPTGVPELFGGASSTIPFTFSGFTTNTPGNPAQATLINNYNQQHNINKGWSNVFLPPSSVIGADLAPGFYPVTMTFLYKPRLTGVIELISEIPPGEKII